MNRVKKISIAEIPFLDFQGYYWYSDATEPILQDYQKIDAAIFKPLPFIVEGNFYNADQQISIQVKHLDGAYQLFQYDLSGQESKAYIANGFLRSQGILKYKMVETWAVTSEQVGKSQGIVEQDPLAGMAALEPAWSAFAGFSK